MRILQSHNLRESLQLPHPLALPLALSFRQKSQITLKLPPDPQHALEMLLAHHLGLGLRQDQRGTDAVADLAAVEGLFAPGVGDGLEEEWGVGVLVGAEVVEEERPDFLAAGAV